MKIIVTLEEVLDKCYDWQKFCDAYGYSVNAVTEGGGDIEVDMSLEDARLFGIIREGK